MVFNDLKLHWLTRKHFIFLSVSVFESKQTLKKLFQQRGLFVVTDVCVLYINLVLAFKFYSKFYSEVTTSSQVEKVPALSLNIFE